MGNNVKSDHLEHLCRYWLCLFIDGIRDISKNALKAVIATLYWVLAITLMRHELDPVVGIIAKFLQPVVFVGTLLLSACLFVLWVTVSILPPNIHKTISAFRSIHFFNSAGTTPLPVRWEQTDGIAIRLELLSIGMPLDNYQDRISEIEAALNCRISKIDEGKDKQHIVLYILPGNSKLPNKVIVNDMIKNSHMESSKITLGESIDGVVEVDLNKTAHMLIAGSTGSGKTTLLKSIVFQALSRSDPSSDIFDVVVIDMKGGTDYLPSWKQACDFAYTPDDALSLLSSATQELEQRKISFEEASEAYGVPCSSLDDYNQIAAHSPLHRKLIVIDEIAELTDTTGMSKSEKERAAAIVSKLSTIARLGRAFGISLVIGTQRPDATAVPGQIKNNIDYRVCGKADNTLSMIILDNTSAADQIPKDSQGLFLNQDGTLFRGCFYASKLK